ncbi:hypothetical protein Q2298_08510 [Rhodococcus electrodiphilus]|uniref:hypothetical protein n=1 Tax=Rhodococcus ruber TaxID=1830 RepID=UPI0026F41553|nr:hypothetical protein [Rhodococcus ruber]MDO2378394.1 hypothetical protein [Rhodococcus ruber]
MAGNRTTPEHRPATVLQFQEHTGSQAGCSADTRSYRYVVKPAGGGWQLRIYPMDTDSGSRVPELFSTHKADWDSKADCIAVAQAFHNLGDSYNEFAYGYRSRFDQAVIAASTNPAEAATPPQPRPAPGVAPRTSPTKSPAVPASTRSPKSAGRVNRTDRIKAPRTADNPTGDPAVAAVLRRRVFVGKGAPLFHAKYRCRTGETTSRWCTAAEAHRSRLAPCPTCCTRLGRFLQGCLGTIPNEERKTLPLPTLRIVGGKDDRKGISSSPRRSRKKAGSTRRRGRSGSTSKTTRYGRPTSIDDPRFSNRSSLGWGTASYGQHPEEFLGSPTDDDHDWRGGHALYE